MSQPLILVTGGGGFLGQAIVQRCLDRGWRVRATGRTPRPNLVARGVEFMPGDIADTSHARKAVEGCAAVFHVAAKAGVWGPRADYFRSNVLGTRAIAEACVAAGVGDLVHTSTPSVTYNGSPIRGADESMPLGKDFPCAYAETKAIAEDIALSIHRAGTRVCALRPHLVWGPGDPHIFPRLLAKARAGRLRIIGDGANLVDVTHLDTAADAHLAALDALRAGRANGRAYFISQGEPVRLWDFINRLLHGAGAPEVRRHVPLPVAWAAGAALEATWTALRLPGEPPMTRFVASQLGTDHWFDTSASRRDLGLRPAVDTWEALDRLASGLRKQG
jgi:nucleoside-diphosphate-sugar epimerase